MMKRYKDPSKCLKCEGKLKKKEIGKKVMWICETCKMVYPHPCITCKNYAESWGACELEPDPHLLEFLPDLFKPKYNNKECSEYVKRN
jgi:hypothetical protein